MMQEIAQVLRDIADELRDRAERGGPSVSIKAFNANAKRKAAGWIEAAVIAGCFPEADSKISSLYANGHAGYFEWPTVRRLLKIASNHWTTRYDSANPPKRRMVRCGIDPTDASPTFLEQWTQDQTDSEQSQWLTEQSLAWAEILRILAAKIDTSTAVIKPAEKTTKATRHDTKDDTQEKTTKKRSMNVKAKDCARLYRENNGQMPMKMIIEDYVEQHGGRFSTIMRTLNDNPKCWKSDT